MRGISWLAEEMLGSSKTVPCSFLLILVLYYYYYSSVEMLWHTVTQHGRGSERETGEWNG
jgi:hypothetical protein